MELNRSKSIRRSPESEGNCAEGLVRTANDCMQFKTYNVQYPINEKLKNSFAFHKGHVTRSNFSCTLQHNKRCVASCKKKFACTTLFCNCNCCVASWKKSRTTLYFTQRCETSCVRVTSPKQLATQFSQNGSIRAHHSQDVSDLARPPSCLLLYVLQVAKKVAHV